MRFAIMLSICASPSLTSMRQWLAVAIVLAGLQVPDLAQGQAAAVAIRHVTVVAGTTTAPLSDATIVIRGGRIDALGPASAVAIPAGAQVIDGGGRFAIPGLIDTHVHIASSAGSPDVERILGYQLASGITGVRDASGAGRERELIALRDRINAGDVLAPRLYVSGSATPQNIPRHGASNLEDLVRRLRDLGVDGLKLRNLNKGQADTVIHQARALGLPAFGHTYGLAPGLDFTLDALQAGAAGVMHVSGIGPARSVKPRTLAATGWQRDWLMLYLQWLDATEEEEQQLLRALLSQRAWLEPTLTTESFVLEDARYRNRPETRFLGTPYEQARQGFPVFTGSDLELARQGFTRMQAFVRRFQADGGVLLAGTDMLPWPGPGLHEELLLLVEAGLSPMSALQAATRNAARALGWEARTGTIAVGLSADLVLLEANPLLDITNTTKIWAVVRAGHVLTRPALDTLLAVRRK